MMTDFARLTSARLALPGAVLALVLAAPVAHAQAPAAPTQQAAKAPAPEWIKVCGKEDDVELCSVASYIMDNAGNVRGQIRVVDLTKDKEKKRVINVMVQPGFLIQPGINLVIDDAKEPIPGRYRICYPNACMAEVVASDDVLASIRKGSNMTVFFANQQGQWLGGKVSLAGFSAAYDGAALDPKVAAEKRKSFEEGQNKLQSELAKRAEEQRKKLQEKAGTAAAPAAAKTQ